MADYNKVGLLVLREGKILLCRKKRGTSLLILPGGCLEEGESAVDCLRREVREELGDVAAVNLEFLGTYRDRAASQEETKTVQIELYSGELDGQPEPHSEIAELVWFGRNDDVENLSPSLRNKILPDLVARGMISSR